MTKTKKKKISTKPSNLKELSEPEALQTHRIAINELDAQLVHLLTERFKRAAKISEIKQSEGIPIRQKKREVEIITRAVSLCPIEEVRKDIKNVFGEILKSSRRLQELTLKRNWLIPLTTEVSKRGTRSSQKKK
ncbi:MAG: chorismate mutase [Chloroherpetonaceae bacterium]|nr:chorismate mutase [Chloroherpetonaceae bacterium]